MPGHFLGPSKIVKKNVKKSGTVLRFGLENLKTRGFHEKRPENPVDHCFGLSLNACICQFSLVFFTKL